ncbi:MAG TPA: hypothetical protein VMY43_08980 [Methanothrix sp.]|nr:hypothetical protein [Methanothrix sp.]
MNNKQAQTNQRLPLFDIGKKEKETKFHGLTIPASIVVLIGGPVIWIIIIVWIVIGVVVIVWIVIVIVTAWIVIIVGVIGITVIRVPGRQPVMRGMRPVCRCH